MSPGGVETENRCAGEAQQQFNSQSIFEGLTLLGMRLYFHHEPGYATERYDLIAYPIPDKSTSKRTKHVFSHSLGMAIYT
jgi:hypothetical protein